MTVPDQAEQSENMLRMYRRHAAFYDATRRLFLFGRDAITRLIPAETGRLIEVGCGTGYNLSRLARRYPELQLTGIDVSTDMLSRARKATQPYGGRIRLIEAAYGPDLSNAEPPDVVLFSYSLTMFNPGWEAAIEQAWRDLPAGGRIVVVDFLDADGKSFLWWMNKNHVRMDGHLPPFLQTRFSTISLEINRAWTGWWRYFIYVGQKDPA